MSALKVTMNNCEYGDYGAAMYALRRFQQGLKNEKWPPSGAIVGHMYHKSVLNTNMTKRVESFFFVTKTRAGNWSVTLEETEEK